jgi:flagellar protein FliO/FliZ
LHATRLESIRWIIVIVLLLAPLAALPAQDNAGPPAPQGEEALVIPGAETPREAPAPTGPLVSSWDFVRMLLILGAVVGVIYLLFYLLKRGFRRQLPQNDLIRVLGSRTLSGNRALHLVEMGRSVFLVGAAESGISLISEIKDQETLDRIRIQSAETIRMPQGFAQFFQSLWKAAGKGSLHGDSLSLMKQQRQRLQKM